MTYRVGKFYDVLAIELGGDPVPLPDGTTVTVAEFMGFFRGWLPLLNNFSKDEPFVARDQHGGLPHHAHIDWRFVSDEDYERFQRAYGAQGAELFVHVITFPEEYLKERTMSYRRMRCMRELPALYYRDAYYMPELQALPECAALKAGRCPHRGTPREAMIEQNGHLVCPAHGLRFSRKTGRLVPYRWVDNY